MMLQSNSTLDIPDDVVIEPGGSKQITIEMMPSLIQSIVAALAVMFLILMFHYHKIGISVLSISVSVLCIIGSTVGPHPYPDMVARLQSIISEEIKWQLQEKIGRDYPDYLMACVGGGSRLECSSEYDFCGGV